LRDITLALTGSQRIASITSMGRSHGRASSAAAGMRNLISCRPPSSAINPESAPASRGPIAVTGEPGGGPTAGAKSTASTMPASSATQRCTSHQPSSVTLGEVMPACSRLAPAPP